MERLARVPRRGTGISGGRSPVQEGGGPAGVEDHLERIHQAVLGSLPGRGYREAAERLTAAGYPTTEQSFKNALRDRKPLPENTIPADAPGVRDLVLAVRDIWPSFEWERLVREMPGWLDDLTQNAEPRQVEP